MENQQPQEKPSREQIIKWYTDEIELASYRADLAKLQRDATVSEAERLQALLVIAQITQEPKQDDQVSKQDPDSPAPKVRNLRKEGSDSVLA
jgi:hypothetical protein